MVKIEASVDIKLPVGDIERINVSQKRVTLYLNYNLKNVHLLLHNMYFALLNCSTFP
jgi:hypothetical protein